MKDFLASNPGIESRFTRFINFPDYTPKELCKIFLALANKSQYSLTAGALANLACIFHILHSQRDANFGNGRLVRNLFEKTLGNHSDRLVNLEEISKADLSTVSEEDLPYDEVGMTGPLDFSECKWNAICPSCEKTYQVEKKFLGRNVTCKCGGQFRIPFWNLSPNKNNHELLITASGPDRDSLLYD
jgi:hypothetical protein